MNARRSPKRHRLQAGTTLGQALSKSASWRRIYVHVKSVHIRRKRLGVRPENLGELDLRGTQSSKFVQALRDLFFLHSIYGANGSRLKYLRRHGDSGERSIGHVDGHNEARMTDSPGRKSGAIVDDARETNFASLAAAKSTLIKEIGVLHSLEADQDSVIDWLAYTEYAGETSAIFVTDSGLLGLGVGTVRPGDVLVDLCRWTTRLWPSSPWDSSPGLLFTPSPVLTCLRPKGDDFTFHGLAYVKPETAPENIEEPELRQFTLI